MSDSTDVITTTLALDAANFDRTLDRSKAKSEEWAAHFERRLQAAAQQTEQQSKKMASAMERATKQIGEKMDEMTLKLGAGLYEKMGEAALKTGEALHSAVFDLKAFDKQMEENRKTAVKYAESLERAHAERVAWIDASTLGDGEQVGELERAIEALKRDKTELLSRQSAAEAEVQKREFNINGTGFAQMATSSRARGNFGDWLTGRHAGLEANAKANLEEASKAIDDTNKRLADMQERMNYLRSPDGSPAWKKKIDEMTASLQKQADTWGMTADQVQMYELKVAGASEKQLKKISDVQKEREARLAALNGISFGAGFGLAQSGPDRKVIDDMTAALEKQAATWGLSADAVALYDLKLKGASEAQLKLIEDSQKQRDALIAAKAAMMFAGTFGLLQSNAPAAKIEDKSLSSVAGGTSAAANAIAAASRSTRVATQNDPQTKATKELEALNRKAEKQSQDVAEIRDSIRNLIEAIETIKVA